jgi:hypothetical protein
MVFKPVNHGFHHFNSKKRRKYFKETAKAKMKMKMKMNPMRIESNVVANWNPY